MSTAAKGRTRKEAKRYGPTMILIALSISATTMAVMQTVVSPILPQLQHRLGVSSSAIAWVLTGNLLASAVATPLLGRLGDLRGRKRFLMYALGAVAVGSILAACTTSYVMLIAGRVLQGMGGGVVPLALSVVRDEFPKERSASSIATIGATISVGATFGSVMTGLIADRWDYHLLFWLSALVALLSMAMVWRVVPDTAKRREGRVDLVGALALSGWLCALLASISMGSRSGWGSPIVVGGLLLSVVLFAAWIGWALHHPQPLVDLRVMARRPVLLANLSGIFTGAAMYGASLLFAPFIQSPSALGYGFGRSVLVAGLIMLPGTIGNLAAAPVAARLTNRFGPKPALVLGPVLSGVAFLLLVPLHGHWWAFSMVGVIFGFGLGLAFSAMPALINDNVPSDMTGVANGMNAVLRTVGGATGTAVLGAILGSVLVDSATARAAGVGQAPDLDAYLICFGMLGIGCLIAALLACAIPTTRRKADPVQVVAAPGRVDAVR